MDERKYTTTDYIIAFLHLCAPALDLLWRCAMALLTLAIFKTVAVWVVASLFGH